MSWFARSVRFVILGIFLQGNLLTCPAQTRSFTWNDVTLELADVTADTAVYFTSMRLNRALNVWNVEVAISNKSQRVITGPIVLLVDGFTGTTGLQGQDGTTHDSKRFVDVSGTLSGNSFAPGQITSTRTLTLGFGTGTPVLATRVYAAAPVAEAALALTRTLDEAGRPLPAVEMEIVGPTGTTARQTDPDSGVASFGQAPGMHTIKFNRAGYLPVWRKQNLSLQQTAIVPNPRLVKRASESASLTPLQTAVVSNATGSIQLSVPAGAVGQNAPLTLTPLTGQDLPAFLPLGWSPLRAFWLETSAPLQQPISAALRPLASIANNETAALVRWDEGSLDWLVVQTVLGAGTNALNVTLATTGAYALVVGDAGETAPPAPQVGEPLPGSSVGAISLDGLTATGTVTPPASPASTVPELVTGGANVVLQHGTQRLPSGYLLRGEVTETYLLSDGSLRLTPQYEHFIVGYQRPGDQNPFTLHASFPMRPVLLFGPEQLDSATVRVDVLPETPFEGQVLDETGGQIASSGVRVLAGAGRLNAPSALRLRRLDATVFANLVGVGHSVIAAFDLTVDRSTVDAGLATQLTGAPTNRLFVLARILSDTGFYGLQPIERLQSDAGGNLQSLEPASGERLPGLRGSGQFVLVEVASPQGLISGVARDGHGATRAGLPVRLTGLPWLTLTDEKGQFQLVSPVGNWDLGVTDPATGDTGFAEIQLTNVTTGLVQNLEAVPSGPRVVKITPSHKAERVPRVGSVVIEFNEAVHPGTISGNTVQLLRTNETVVPAAVTLNLRNTIVTLSPTTELDPNTTYYVRLASPITDPTGLPLEGQNQFSFTTVPLSVRDPAAQLIIYEPGATNVPAEVLAQIPAYEPGEDPFAIVVRGTPGTADPEVPVILVNESTGETATVLSRPDGSFASVISGTEEHFVSATFVNLNGTRVYVPVSRQEFDNGFVGLYPQGGILEAESDGGPVKIYIEPHAITTKAKVRIKVPTAAELAQLLGDTVPESAAMLAKPLIFEGETQPMQGPIRASFTVDLAAAGYPTNANPLEAAIALVQVTETDGIKAFEVLDQLQFTPSTDEAAPLKRSGPVKMNSGEQLYYGVANSVIGLVPQAGIANNVFRYALMPILVGGNPIVVKGRAIQSLEFPQLNNPFRVNDPLLRGFKFEQLGSAFKPLELAGQGVDAVNNINNYLTDLLEGRPLSGAFISLQNYLAPAVAGHLRPGMVYATSDHEGNFLMVAPTTPWLELQPNDFYLVMATHPRFREKLSETLFALQDMSIAGVAFKNFVFREPLPVQVPPTVNVAHAPPYPAAGEPVELQVNASQGFQGNPTVNVFVEQVFPADEALSGVTISNVVVTSEGNRTRWSGQIQATNTIRRAMLRVSVIGTSGEPKVMHYPISFTGAPTRTDDGVIPPSDPTETRGPSVTASFPVDGGVVDAGGKIVLTFNEPIDRRVESDVSGIILNPAAAGVLPAVRLSADQTVLTIQYSGLKPDTEYSLTLLGASVMDLNGNPLDQRPSTTEPDAFTMNFRTPPLTRYELPGMVNGVGSAIHGARLYALDHTTPPMLRTYDISNPSRPVLLSSVRVGGTPRDLVVLPDYRYKLNLHQPARTNDLVAVVGGDLDAIIDDLDSVIVKGQYLRVFEMADPRNPVEIASPILTYRVSSVVPKVRWNPPYLVYQEYGQDMQQIVYVNLQELLIGWHALPGERDAFPADGHEGTDADGNGDYTSPGDSYPLPQRRPAEFYGKRQSYIISGSTQKILDFSVSGGTLGVTLTGGYGRTQGGGVNTGNPVFPQYRTMAFNGIDIGAGAVDFASGDYPGRVTIIDGLPVEHEGQLYTPLAALVSLSPDRLGRHRLVVLDISLPESPALIGDITFPEEIIGTGLRSLHLAENGLLELKTSSSVFYLDSRLLSRTNAPVGQLHPAIVGALPDGGGRMRSVASSPAGLHGLAEGGRNEVVQFAPTLSFVNFPLQSQIVDPRDWLQNETEINALFAQMQRAEHLVPARVRTDHLGHTSDLTPPKSELHYYVLVEAPGGAGEKIQLGMESLSPAGWPLPNQGVGFAPVRAVDARTLEALGIQPRSECDAAVRPLTAYRLSNDPRSPNYNRYLSRPFVVIYESVSQAELALLQLTADREVMWSSARMRAFIEPTEQNNPAIGAFAARVDMPRGVIFPMGGVVANTLDVSYIMGPNPPPPGGDVRAPGTFGSVSAHSGEIRTEASDLTLPSPRMGISIERTIGGQDNYDGPYGLGWDFNYNQRITELRPELFPQGFKMPLVARGTLTDSVVGNSKDLLFHTGAGRMVLFQWKGNTMPSEYSADPLVQELNYEDVVADYFLPEPGVFDLLVKFKDGKYERLTPDGMRYRYAANGRLETIIDRFPANRHELEYEFHGWLRRIDDRSVTDDRYVEFGYYRRATDADFVAGLDERSENPHLIGKICRLRDFTGRDVLYFYDEQGLLIRREGVKVDGENGGFAGRNQTHYEYRDCRFVGVSVGPNKVPLMAVATQPGLTGAPVSTGVNGVGGSTGTDIPANNLARTLENLRTQMSQADGRVTEFTFNKFGHPTTTRITGPGITPAVVAQEFNEHGQPLVIQYPEGRVHRMEYDSTNPIFRSRGNLLSLTVEAGPRGGEDYTETYSYSPFYNLPEGPQRDANGFVHQYMLRADKRAVERIEHDAAGTETMAHNANGQLTQRTDVNGIEQSFSFNAATGYLDTSKRGNHTTGYGYSGVAGRLGQAALVTPPRGAATTIAYNANLQPVNLTRGGSVQRMAYDGQGRRTLHVEELGDGKKRETRLTINELGFVEKREVNGIEVNGAETTLSFEYQPDEVFRVKEVHHPGGSVQKFTYDALGNARTMELEGYLEEYVADRHGNMLSVKKGGEIVSTRDYDGLDRPKLETIKTGTSDYLTERTYFAGGQLKSLKITDPVYGILGEQVVNEIDALGRALRVTRHGDVVPSRTDVTVHGVRQRTMTGPRQTVTEEWTSAGYPSRYADAIVNATITTDGNGNIERVVRAEDGATYEDKFTYDPLDHRDSMSDSFGLIAEFTPRADGRNQQIKNARNNITTMDHSALGEVLLRRRNDGMEFRFRHDEQRQLTYTGDADRGFNYDYDNLFRQTQRTLRNGAEITTDAFDPRNQPTQITLPGGAMTMTSDLQTRVKTSRVEFSGTTYETTTDYDALDRVRVVTYEQTASAENTARYAYDKAGPLRGAEFSEDGVSFSVAYNYRNDQLRDRVTYPSGYVVNLLRDNAGRLTGISGTIESIVTVDEWQGNRQPKQVNFGGVLRLNNMFDQRGRVTASRYMRTPGNALQAEMRYQYDGVNNVEMRQFLHRAGKTDNFSYDNGERLSRAQVGGIPFANQSDVSRFLYQRTYNYHATGRDYLLNAPLVSVGGDLPVFAASWSGHDGFLLPTTVGGTARQADLMGRVAQAQLWVRPVGSAAPVPVNATLQHNGLGQLVKVERADGVTIENFYQPDGLRYARKVTQSGGVVDYRHFVYDDAGRLLEEFDRTDAEPQLVGRYFYMDSDAPVAADFPDNTGTLHRHYFVRDNQKSIVAVADRFGVVEERVWYDPFGQPVIEPRDTVAPVIKRVIGGEGGTLLIEMSEPVSAIVFDLGIQAGIRRLTQSFNGLVTQPAGQSELPEVVPGFAPHTVSVFTPEAPVTNAIDVTLSPGRLTDDWDNHVLEQTVSLNTTSVVAGTVYYTAPGNLNTDGGTVARSTVGSPFLFHGQYFDYETGLIYLRARFYDPYSAMFLQPDPLGYEDSVNLYAGLANNPTSRRDPTGLNVWEDLKEKGESWREKVASAISIDGVAGWTALKQSPGAAWNLANDNAAVNSDAWSYGKNLFTDSNFAKGVGGFITAASTRMGGLHPTVAKALSPGIFARPLSALGKTFGNVATGAGLYFAGKGMLEGFADINRGNVGKGVNDLTANTVTFGLGAANAYGGLTSASWAGNGWAAAGSWAASGVAIVAGLSITLANDSINKALEGKETWIDWTWRRVSGQRDTPRYDFRPLLGLSDREIDELYDPEKQAARWKAYYASPQYQENLKQLRQDIEDYNRRFVETPDFGD